MVMVQVKAKRAEKHTHMFPKTENQLMWEIIHSAAVCGCKKAPDWTSEHGFVVDLSYFQSTVYGCDRLTLC